MVILRRKIAALTPASLRARRAAGLRGTVDVLVAGSEALRALNRQFRRKNQATDVLSFPARAPLAGNNGGRAAHAGDIAISADIAAENAARFGHSAAAEVRILTLHGILHLAGFDHERDNGEMARREMKLRQDLGLPVALLQRSQPARPKSSRKRRGHAHR